MSNLAKKSPLTDGEFSAFAPDPSPDGKWIALQPRVNIGITDMPERLVVMSTDGADSRVINESLDREVFDRAWSPESNLCSASKARATSLPWSYDPQTDKTDAGARWQIRNRADLCRRPMV